jgi:hypothetical protein
MLPLITDRFDRVCRRHSRGQTHDDSKWTKTPAKHVMGATFEMEMTPVQCSLPFLGRWEISFLAPSAWISGIPEMSRSWSVLLFKQGIIARAAAGITAAVK